MSGKPTLNISPAQQQLMQIMMNGHRLSDTPYSNPTVLDMDSGASTIILDQNGTVEPEASNTSSGAFETASDEYSNAIPGKELLDLMKVKSFTPKNPWDMSGLSEQYPEAYRLVSTDSVAQTQTALTMNTGERNSPSKSPKPERLCIETKPGCGSRDISEAVIRIITEPPVSLNHRLDLNKRYPRLFESLSRLSKDGADRVEHITGLLSLIKQHFDRGEYRGITSCMQEITSELIRNNIPLPAQTINRYVKIYTQLMARLYTIDPTTDNPMRTLDGSGVYNIYSLPEHSKMSFQLYQLLKLSGVGPLPQFRNNYITSENINIWDRFIWSAEVASIFLDTSVFNVWVNMRYRDSHYLPVHPVMFHHLFFTTTDIFQGMDRRYLSDYHEGAKRYFTSLNRRSIPSETARVRLSQRLHAFSTKDHIPLFPVIVEGIGNIIYYFTSSMPNRTYSEHTIIEYLKSHLLRYSTSSVGFSNVFLAQMPAIVDFWQAMKPKSREAIMNSVGDPSVDYAELFAHHFRQTGPTTTVYNPRQQLLLSHEMSNEDGANEINRRVRLALSHVKEDSK